MCKDGAKPPDGQADGGKTARTGKKTVKKQENFRETGKIRRNVFDKRTHRNYNGKVAGFAVVTISRGYNKEYEEKIKGKDGSSMDGGSAYHAETEDGRKRIPALHFLR